VDREGTMTGTDLDWFARLRAATRLAITAAGGIHTLEEIQALDKLGINAAVGMAVYTGKLSLDVLRTVLFHHEDTKNTKTKSTE
jgi:phosphoribosylformimino-5-aminoimidazole carboxamide ribonucleotide (ProFAR) isomerase